MAAPTREGIAGLLGPVVARSGFDLEDVSVSPAGKRRVLRVVVDSDDGVDLDDIASVSHDVSDALEESDAMGTMPYVLEVTSPGVDRPLTAPRHWRRARARLVSATLADGSVVVGRVLDASDSDDGAASLQLDGGATREVSYADVTRAQVQVEFAKRSTFDDLADLDDRAGGDDLSDDLSDDQASDDAEGE